MTNKIQKFYVEIKVTCYDQNWKKIYIGNDKISEIDIPMTDIVLKDFIVLSRKTLIEYFKVMFKKIKEKCNAKLEAKTKEPE